MRQKCGCFVRLVCSFVTVRSASVFRTPLPPLIWDDNLPRRQILNARQRAALFDLPTDQETLLRHYTLADDDIEQIQSRRRAHNRFGFALQLCAFRFPGRLLVPGEVIPSEITDFLAAQLGLNADDLADYAHRAETRREHLADLREVYGYKMFTGRGARDLTDWLAVEAETAQMAHDR